MRVDSTLGGVRFDGNNLSFWSYPVAVNSRTLIAADFGVAASGHTTTQLERISKLRSTATFHKSSTPVGDVPNLTSLISFKQLGAWTLAHMPIAFQVDADPA